jgi:predicted small lipoprotein YifL
MFGVLQILVSTPAARRRVFAMTAAAVLLCACGQKGPLLLPTGAAAQGRASLPDTLTPSATAIIPSNGASAAAIPPTGTASPIRNP